MTQGLTIYIPLIASSAKAMLDLQKQTNHQQIDFINQIFDQHAEQRQGYELIKINCIPHNVARKSWDGIARQQVAIRTPTGKFYSFNRDVSEIEEILSDMKEHWATDDGVQTLNDLKTSLAFPVDIDKPHPLQAEVRQFFYTVLQPAIAAELDKHLRFVDCTDNPQITARAAIAPDLWVNKYPSIDYSGKSGKAITYGLSSGSSGHAADDILEFVCNECERLSSQQRPPK